MGTAAAFARAAPLGTRHGTVDRTAEPLYMERVITEPDRADMIDVAERRIDHWVASPR
jgi:hypothetical protein